VLDGHDLAFESCRESGGLVHDIPSERVIDDTVGKVVER
jgi:hypothetical protein